MESNAGCKHVPMVTRPHSPWLAHTHTGRGIGSTVLEITRWNFSSRIRTLVLISSAARKVSSQRTTGTWALRSGGNSAERRESLALRAAPEISVSYRADSFPRLPHAHTAHASSTPPPTTAFKSCSAVRVFFFFFSCVLHLLDYSAVTKHSA